MTFAQHVKSLAGLMEEIGNPFIEEHNNMVRLDTRDILDPTVATSVRQAEQIE